MQCGECDSHYVGETERQLKIRVNEHQKRKSSHVFQHLKQHEHTFSSTEDVSVLHTESDWFKRGVAESIHILRKRPTINRDRGRHTLPPHIPRGHPMNASNHNISTAVISTQLEVTVSPEEDGRIATESSTA